jgi:multiple sugar transport system permease protein
MAGYIKEIKMSSRRADARADVVREPRLSRRTRQTLEAGVIHLTLMAGAVALMLPLVWMLSTSLKPRGAVFLFPPEWIPRPIVWQNYVQALTAQPFHLFYRNTVAVTSISMVGMILSSSIVAFSFARISWIGRDIVFLMVLATMMLPFHVTIIPQFIIFRHLNWLNTFLPLIIPTFFGGSFFIFLLRQFFMTIPLEMDDAARIDGCSTLGIYWRIIMPQSKPALMAVGIFTFQNAWSEFFRPLIFLQSKERWTVPIALRTFEGEFGADWNLIMAASFVAIVPPIVLFFFGQKYFIQGVVFTGVEK